MLQTEQQKGEKKGRAEAKKEFETKLKKKDDEIAKLKSEIEQLKKK
jgi:hypothetical protein